MAYNVIFNRPYFVVPPDAPQVQLLLDRIPLAEAPGWYSDQLDGTRYFSIAVYFGTLIVHPDGATPREVALREALGFPPTCTLRLDYACSRNALYLLRAGEPGTEPRPFRDFTADGCASAEAFIDDFLSTDLRSILLGRRVQDIETDFFFAEENCVYVGFLGDCGMPLQLERTDDPRFAVGNAILAAIP